MRRKKRFGVPSNGTIKRCACSSGWCGVCKGVCKVGYRNARVDPKSEYHGYPDYGRTRLNQVGKGSLMPGKKFVYFDKHFKYAYLRDERAKQEAFRERELKTIAKEEIEYWNHLNGLEEMHYKELAKRETSNSE